MKHIKNFESFSHITESTLNEGQYKKGDKVEIMYPTMTKPLIGIVSTIINANGEEVLVLKDDKGVWDAKFAKLIK
jgi:hypothetical protein